MNLIPLIPQYSQKLGSVASRITASPPKMPAIMAMVFDFSCTAVDGVEDEVGGKG